MQRRDFIKSFLLCASSVFLSGCGSKNNQNNITRKSLKHVEIHLVEHCNLKCKYCSHFSCIAEEEFYDAAEYERDMAQLSKITQKEVEVIQLLGGEPLLHPDINKLIDITRKYFPKSQVDLITNGMLLDSMPVSFWQTMYKNNVFLVPSIYPIKINWESILDKAKKNNVNVTTDGREEEIKLTNIERHRIRYFSKFNIDLKGSQNPDKPCSMRELCANFVHGKLYPCFAVSNIKHFNKKFHKKIPVTKKDYVDIYKAKNIDELINLVSNPGPFCKYCNQYNGGGYWMAIVNHQISEWVM